MKTLLGVRGVGVGVTEDNVTDDLDDGDDNNDWVVAKEPTDVEFPGVGGSDEGDDEVEDHLEQRSRDFVNARLQQDQGHGHPYTYNYIGGAQGHQQLNSISSPGVSFPAVSGHEDIMFAPKCLLLLSRHDYPEVLRNILCVIYTVYNECLVGVGGEKLKLENPF